MNLDRLEIQFPFEMPILSTERLELRQIQKEDVDGLFELYSDSTIMQPFVSKLHSEKSQTLGLIKYLEKGFNRRTLMMWGIFKKNEPRRIIADIGFWRFVPQRSRAEITGKMSPHLWNQGLSREALEAVDRFGFQVLNLNSIEANIDPENLQSIRLVEREGYEKEGYIREHTYCAVVDIRLYMTLSVSVFPS